MLRYTHWFWDFDGTLFDTYPRVVRAFQKGLRLKGIGVSDDEVLRLVKITLGHAAQTLGRDEAEREELLRLYFANAEGEGPEGLITYPGAADVLHKVVRLGSRNYLYTHRDRSGPEALALRGLEGLFVDMVTHEHSFPHKPAPDALLHLIEKHALSPADCVMVGDRPIDVDAAHNAGIDSILFDPDGFYPDYPASHRFRSFAEMLEVLRNSRQ